MNDFLIISLAVTLLVLFTTIYMLSKLRKGYGAGIPTYFQSPFIKPQKATELNKFILLVEVVTGFVTTIFGVILILESL